MRISVPTRRAINNVICDTNQFPTMWDRPGAAITSICQTLAVHGLEVLGIISWDDKQEDYRHNYGLVNTQDGHNEIQNAMLVFAWHRMGDRYEITAYIS